MIPLLDIQGAGPALGQIGVTRDAGTPDDDPEAAHDFLKVYGPGTAGLHGPMTSGKPGARQGSKTAVEDEGSSAGPDAAFSVVNALPRSVPKAQSDEPGTIATTSDPLKAAGPVGIASGIGALVVPAGQSAAGPETEQLGLVAAGPLQSQIAGSAISLPGTLGLVPEGLPILPELEDFTAPQGTGTSMGLTSAPGVLANSAPDAGPASQPTDSIPGDTGVDLLPIAEDLTRFPNPAVSFADTTALAANAARQKSSSEDVSPRGTLSQAATILIWQAGIGTDTSGAPKTAPSGLTKSKSPQSLPSAPIAAPGPVSQTDAALPPQYQTPQPGGDMLPPKPTAEKPAGGVITEIAPQPPDPGAPALFAPLGAALNKPVATATTLPAPFHPLVAAIHLQAAAHGHLATDQAGAELLLHPADLGRIRFALSGTGDQLTITIAAENPDTLRLLQRHATDLRAELAREGLGQAALSFAGPGSGNSGGQGARGQPFAAPPAAEQTELAPPIPLPPTSLPPAAIARQSDGGLDLRL